MSKEFYTAKEVASIATVCQATVRGWAATGKLPAIKMGRGWRVPAAAVDALKAHGTAPMSS